MLQPSMGPRDILPQAGYAQALPTSDGLLLLKVPRWVSKAWLAAGPGSAVADLDLEGGRLKILGDQGAGRPSTLGLERRASPEFFAFEQEEGRSEVPLEGAVPETISVKADLGDESYRGLLRQRREQSSIGSGKRTAHLERIVQFDQKPVIESAEKPVPLSELVEKCLAESEKGLTLQELLAQLPPDSGFRAVRDALTTVSESIEVNSTQYFLLRGRAGRLGGETAQMPPPKRLRR
mmetsp:Transcript_1599/g.3312  ORF Transcript_1599/g.3312 Transcript_1599/m.3312 type:complete len:236 (+) Transcript_1599:64-771(+)